MQRLLKFFLILLVFCLGLSWSYSSGKVKIPSVREISVSGDRSASEVYGTIEQNVSTLRLTYNQYLENVSGFAGRVILELAISSDGTVEDCLVEESTTGVSDFDEMIRNLVSGWRFEKAEGGNASAKFPIVFTE